MKTVLGISTLPSTPWTCGFNLYGEYICNLEAEAKEKKKTHTHAHVGSYLPIWQQQGGVRSMTDELIHRQSKRED